MRKKFFLAVSATIVAAAAIGGVYVVNNSPVADELFDSNVEVLARDEQPNTVMCIFDPNYDCEALHPTDPDKDQISYYAKWW